MAISVDDRSVRTISNSPLSTCPCLGGGKPSRGCKSLLHSSSWRMNCNRVSYGLGNYCKLPGSRHWFVIGKSTGPAGLQWLWPQIFRLNSLRSFL